MRTIARSGERHRLALAVSPLPLVASSHRVSASLQRFTAHSAGPAAELARTARGDRVPGDSHDPGGTKPLGARSRGGPEGGGGVMKQRVPARTWYSSSERRRPRLLIEDGHRALEISDFTAFRDAGFDVAFCSGPASPRGPAPCCAEPTVRSWPRPTSSCTGSARKPVWWPASGGGIRNCRSSSRAATRPAGARPFRPAARSGAGGRRAAGPGEGRRERGRGRRLDRDGDLAGQAVAAGQPQVVAAPEAAGVVPARAVAAGQQAHGLIGGGQYLAGGVRRARPRPA